MSEDLVLWHDFNVSLVAASAGLLGLLFVALSIHVRVLSANRTPSCALSRGPSSLATWSLSASDSSR
ncbi:MAG: hypothetical protein M3P38_08000 [Chloroflexota bacterium]|nr:hypothetical protein [Chloroflexota bacterium]